MSGSLFSLAAIQSSLMQTPSWIWSGAYFVLGGALILAWISVVAVVWIYAERKIAGYMQQRIGPNRVGPYGLLQSIADGIKLLAKEDIVPQVASKALYFAAPLLVFIGAFLPFTAIPFSDRLVVVNMELGLFYILAFEALEVIGILMAAWAPGSKWTLYGGMRLAAQMLSYEVPMGICILVIIILTGSLNLAEIVNWQSRDAFGLEHPWILGWAVFRSPAALVAFILFYVGGLASTKRAPFDLPEAESELVAGYHTEYSGMRFAFFFLAEYAAMYIICAVAAVIFLGGWHGPVPRFSGAESISLIERWSAHYSNPGAVLGAAWAFASDKLVLQVAIDQAICVFNMLLKSFGLYFIMIWMRWTLPRIRIDQVMYICLKVLLPFSLVCLFIALGQVLVW